jgi:hypothetical protein
MAMAFLAISRRERNAVTTTTDTATARLAADAALANAEAQIVAGIFATTNAAAYNFGLLVSTNYFNPAVTNGAANPVNVNYDSPVLSSPDNRNQVLANLFYAARAPVYMTNLLFHTNENRFYLDLNRNGRDDPSGWVTNVDNTGNFIKDASGNLTANLQVGDPEWVGLLERPDTPHGPNNQFVARYAFIAVPVGNTLDLNAIHNQVFDENNGLNSTVNPLPANGDNYFRNQGVGSWEINLAAFLADLNTNEWGQVVGSGGLPIGSATYYQYNQPFLANNKGCAFDDARALLAYRYNNSYTNLATADQLFSNMPSMFPYNIDGYSDGPLQTTLNTNESSSPDDPRKPWAGADNPIQFFTHQELFDTNKTEIGAALPGFSDRLLAAGMTNSTYDRYTFYRLLSQLGSDSAPESGKINLNYSNAVVSFDTNGYARIAIVPGAETNLTSWTATNFFLAAADRLLRLYTTNWFQEDPSNYLLTYYGIAVTNNSYTYTYANGFTTNFDPTGLGMTNIPLWGMTNQIPAFGITNIPVMINTNFVYTPAVNRLLQLAANIYDSVYYTSNGYEPPQGSSYPGAYSPTVFRPIFNVTNEYNFNGVLAKDVYICGFSEVTNAYEADEPLSLPWNLGNPGVFGNLNLGIHNLSIRHDPLNDNLSPINFFGVPMIIGAKKGFPNFNEFYMESVFQLTRKLMVTRQGTNVSAPPPLPSSSFFSYYEMFNLSLNNQFGVECWNSYQSNYTRPIDIYVTNFLVMTLTNDENNFSFTTNLIAGASLSFPNSTNLVWPGYTNLYYSQAPGSFQIPLTTNFAAIPASRYLFNHGSPPYLSTNLNLWYEVGDTTFGQYPQPHWWLAMTNNLQVIMVDDKTGRLIDYVLLRGPNSFRDLTGEILSGYDTMGSGSDTYYNDLWDTNLINGVPNGFSSQFDISQGNGTPIWSSALWSQDEQTAYDQMNAFIAFTMGSSGGTISFSGYASHPDQIAAALMTNAMQMPYTPSARVVQDIAWQANDPLVHYMASDLIDPTAGNGLSTLSLGSTNGNWPGNLGTLSKRYQPWGGNPSTSMGTNLLAIKDPLVTCSDDWNFPTNKFPTVGWLGRVHRGTPWQTVYLKAPDILSYPYNFGAYGNGGPNLWVNWTGNVNPFDVTNTAPKKDWLLFDLFTTAFNDNATRGQLSVNVAADRPDPAASLAAWSAVLSGVIVLSNNAVNPPINQTASSMTMYTNLPISPAGPGTNSALWQIVNGIYQTRTNFVNPDGVRGTFEHVGYILSVPQLTTQSPFLNWNNSVQQRSGISDAMYEWLPQQIMSLLRDGSPRYVIYCYGQTLKPAPDSLVTGGPNFGMCTNYQVVAESAARAVVRVEGATTPAPHVVVESYNLLPPD